MNPEILLSTLHTINKLKDTTRHCYTPEGRHAGDIPSFFKSESDEETEAPLFTIFHVSLLQI